MFDQIDPVFVPTDLRSVSMTLGLETKKLIASTCRSVLKLELTLSKLDNKLSELEQHRHNGTIPKDLSLPKKKSLFEDEQSKVDDILKSAATALLMQRMAEIARKRSEILARKTTVENNFLKTLDSSRDSQLKLLSPEDLDSISHVKKHALNVHSFYSHLA